MMRGWLSRLFGSAEPVKVTRQEEKDLRVELARLSSDPNVMAISGRRVRLDTDALFLSGKGWEDLESAERDDQVIACRQQRDAVLTGADWAINYDEGDEAGEEKRDLILACLDRLDVPALIQGLLDGVYYGFAPAEVLWARRDRLIAPEKIIVKPAAWFGWSEDDELLFSPDGYGAQFVPLPPRKFLCLRHKPRVNRPHGLKLLAALYWLIYLRKHAWKYEAIFLEKFAVPGVVASYSRDASSDELAKVDEALRAWSTDMGIRIPDAVKLQIIQHQAGAGTSPFEAARRSLNAAIAKVILGSSLTIEAGSESGKGTQALGSVHEVSFSRICQGDARLVEGVFDELIRWIVDLNYGVQPTRKLYPWLALQIDKQALDEARNRETREWLRAGLPVPTAHAYEIAQIPPPGEDDEVLQGGGSTGVPPVAEPMAMSASTAGTAVPLTMASGIESRIRAAEVNSATRLRRFEDSAIRVGSNAVNAMVRDFNAALRSLMSPERAQKWLALQSSWLDRLISGQTDSIDPAPLADTLRQTRLCARLLGELAVRDEVAAQTDEVLQASDGGLALRRYADDEDNIDWAIKPEEAIAAQRVRLGVDPERWREMLATEKALAWSYAAAPSQSLVDEAQALLEKHIEEGLPYNQFLESMQDSYDKLGLTKLSNHYTENIYRTTVLGAYGRGRWSGLRKTDPGIIPYYRYTTAADERVRAEHAVLEGVYPRDDGFWTTNWPPIDFQCRCSVQAVSEGRMRENNWQKRDWPGGTIARAGFGSTEGWKE